MVYALSTWKLYLYKHFDVFTDNRAVFYLRSKPHLSKPEARWAELLAEFHFTIHHVAGKINPADPLTRRSESELWAELGCLEFSSDLHPEEAQLIENGYADDQEMQHIINRLLTAGDDDSFRDKYYWDATRNRLYLVDSTPARLCIPRGPVRLKLLQENHDCITAGHPGRDRTFSKFSKLFYWPGMGRSVKELSAPATRLSDTRVQEEELISFNPYLYQKDHGKRSAWTLSWACQEQHDTMTLCLPLWTK